MINPLHPYLGRQDNDLPMVPFGEDLPSDYISEFDANKVRSVGFRAPLVLVGWGYDKQGRPVPHDRGNLNKLNNTDNNHASVNFSGGYPYPSGGKTPIEAYYAAPLHVRWDHRTGLWDTDHTFFAKLGEPEENIIPEEADRKLYPKYKYPWSEIAIIDSRGLISPPQYPASGDLTHSYAFNISEYGQEEAPPLPSGSVVKMTSIRVNNVSGDEGNEKLLFYFNQGGTGGSSHYIAKIVGSTPMDGSNLRWTYSWMPQKWNGQTFIDDEDLASTLNLNNTAINIVETNNLNIAHPGISMDSAAYPASFSLQPISSGTLVRMNTLSDIKFYFEAYNVHDGACPTCGSCPG